MDFHSEKECDNEVSTNIKMNKFFLIYLYLKFNLCNSNIIYIHNSLLQVFIKNFLISTVPTFLFSLESKEEKVEDGNCY